MMGVPLYPIQKENLSEGLTLADQEDF